MELNYIITNTGLPTSFDPLDADKTVNLTEMRMLYATPLQLSRENTLISNVLEFFEYNLEKKLITFVVKKGIVYSDNTPITVRDVALAISRLVYFRPEFPILKHILGLDKWIKENKGLITFPEGINLIGQKIEIFFTHSHQNSLFRFCLELFSIIPEKYINLHTGVMICSRAPSSGYYVVESLEEEKIVFRKRLNLNLTAEEVRYEKIIFFFTNLNMIRVDEISSDSIIAGVETDFIKIVDKDKFITKQIHWTAGVKFNALLFNPHITPFDKKENRAFFANKVREYLQTSYPSLTTEKSLLTSTLPGYLPSKDFLNLEMNNLLLNFKEKNIAILKSESITNTAIEAIAKRLEMKIEYIYDLNESFLDKAFIEGKLQIDTSSSSFWIQDPTSDIAMYFTPNLHPSLYFLWQDKMLYELISSLENETDLIQIQSKLEKINRHIFDNSLLSPVLHFRKFFITNRAIKKLNLHQAITSPAPWQLSS